MKDNLSSKFMVTAHLAPPTHGMAVITAAFIDLLRDESNGKNTEVVVRRISADPGLPRVAHHLQRIGRVLAGVREILRFRRSLTGIYVSSDAGLGMVYTMLICVAARCCGLPAYVHHHSGSYLDSRREVRMELLCRLAGRRACHEVYGELMAERYIEFYRRRNVEVLPVCFAIAPPKERDSQLSNTNVNDPWTAEAPIRVGHLSNLSVAKGLGAVFETATELAKRGCPVELIIAGPPATPSDEECLQALLDNASYNVRYLGPVYGSDRDWFFQELDFFVFPSRYRHESFGLVAGEALSAGVPIVAYGNISLTADLVGDGGLILPKSADFAVAAAQWICTLRNNRECYVAALAGARSFALKCESATVVARRVARRMLGV